MLDELDPHLPDDHRRTSDGLGVDDGEGRVWLTLVPSDTAALAALADLPALPAEVTADEIPLAQFDPAVIPATEVAMVEWHLERWPEAPGLRADVKHAGVALTVNCSGLWELLPAGPGCRLYVVTRASTELGRHAEMAAAAVGRTVAGPPEGY